MIVFKNIRYSALRCYRVRLSQNTLSLPYIANTSGIEGQTETCQMYSVVNTS